VLLNPHPDHVLLKLLTRACSSRKAMVVVASGGGKVDINKQGLNAIDDPTVQQNLMGRSRFMNKKDWKDASGRQGKVGRASSSACAVGKSRVLCCIDSPRMV
jgi:hypothetical protein